MKFLYTRLIATSLSSVASVLLLSTGAQAAIRNVPATYPTIQSAINASVAGDTIVVAPGIYPETVTWTNKDLTIQGAGEGLSIIDRSNAQGVAGARCLRTQNLTTASRIEGFTFRNANAPNTSGGGMQNTNSSLTVMNCTFTNNTAPDGGGMQNSGSNVTLTNCTFSNNTALVYGGGIKNESNSNVTLTNCTFSSNTAGVSGAGMDNRNSRPTLTNCIISNNTATTNGGGIFSASGGGLTAKNCIFSNNTATMGAGGGIYGNNFNDLTVTNCAFNNNRAASGLGGGIYFFSSNILTATNCTFSNNTARLGGGLYTDFVVSSTIVNCIFTQNLASSGGGGMYNGRNPQRPIVTNCTFSSNTAADGGGMYSSGSGPVMTNCILWGNQATAFPAIGGPAAVTYSLVQGLPNNLPDADGNFATNPLFADATNGDLRLLPNSPAVNHGDNAALPLDALDLDNDGDITELLPIDLAGNPRIVDGLVDLGAYEYQGIAEVSGIVQVTRGGLRRNNATGRYIQQVTLRNNGANTVSGSLALVLDNLGGAGVTLFNKSGNTIASLPAGSPYLNTTINLAPGASTTLTLEFTNPANGPITYTTRIIAGSGAR